MTAWRKTIMTEKTLLKLEDAFKLSLTDEEACLEVWISTSPFYDYCQKNPKFAKRKELLKKTPNIQAKKNWLKEIKGGNYGSSKEWLERKSKDEFSLKTVWENINKNIDYEVEDKDEFKDLLKDNDLI